MGRHVARMHSGYDQKGKAAIITPGSGQQTKLFSALFFNRSGVASDVGLMVKLATAAWRLGTLTTGGTVLTDKTSTIQAQTNVNLVTTVNNDGVLIQATKKFGMVGLEVAQAQTVAPVYVFEYWNGAAFVNIGGVIETPTFTATGTKTFVFPTPRDWAVGGTLADAAKYAIRIRATTAPGQAVIISDAWLAYAIMIIPQVANNGMIMAEYPYHDPLTLDANESVLPYFGTASASNMVQASFFNYD